MTLTENARGAAAMMAAMAGFSINDAILKAAFVTVPLGQALVCRSAIAVALALLLVRAMGGWGRLGDLRHPMVLLRTALDAGTTICFLTALAHASLATATAVLQTTPLLATAIAALVLREPVGWRRWLATAAGLVGVLIIIDPFQADGFEPVLLLALAAALFAAGRDLSTRGAPAGTPMAVVALSAVLGNIVLGGALGLGETWINPGPNGFALLFAAGTSVMAAHFFVAVAMRSGDVSAVTPFRYAIVVFAALWSWALFAEPPSAQDLLGIAIVVGAGLYTLRRERARAAAAPEISRTAPGEAD